MLPIILYNLVQHLGAGVCDRSLRRPAAAAAHPAEPRHPPPSVRQSRRPWPPAANESGENSCKKN